MAEVSSQQILPPSPRKKSVVHWKASEVLEKFVDGNTRAKSQMRRKDTDDLSDNNGESFYKRFLCAPERQARVVTFDTIGKAPVEAPVRPARLTPVRLMTPSPALLDATTLDFANTKVEDSIASTQCPPRTFSRQCRHVMQEQGKVVPFDVFSIYLGCEFFKDCSHSFLRELIRAGGTHAWRGLSVPPHVNVYRDGDVGHSMYVIGRGTAESIAPNGEVKREYGISDYFGEVQVLGVNTRRLETIRSKTTLQLFVTTQSTLTRLLKGSHIEEQEEDLPAYTSTSSAYNPPAVRKNGRKSQVISSTFADERRHFETESVRIYKYLAGLKQTGKRPTVVRKATSGKLMVDQRPWERLEDSMRRMAAEKEARLEAIVAAVTGGNDCLEVVQARDRLLDKVVASLRGDLRCGYMMPADHCDQAGSGEKLHGAPSPPSRRKMRSEKEIAEAEISLLTPVSADDDEDEDAMKNDSEDPLDPHLLPPLKWLSPVQKHGILRQLKHQSRGKIGNAARRGQTAKTADYLTVGAKGVNSMTSISFGVNSMTSMTTSTGGDETSFGDD